MYISVFAKLQDQFACPGLSGCCDVLFVLFAFCLNFIVVYFWAIQRNGVFVGSGLSPSQACRSVAGGKSLTIRRLFSPEPVSIHLDAYLLLLLFIFWGSIRFFKLLHFGGGGNMSNVFAVTIVFFSLNGFAFLKFYSSILLDIVTQLLIFLFAKLVLLQLPLNITRIDDTTIHHSVIYHYDCLIASIIRSSEFTPNVYHPKVSIGGCGHSPLAALYADQGF